MKKMLVILMAGLMLFAATAFPVSARKGDVVNHALYTDIVAYINGFPIESFNVDGYTYIIAEDLANYGFSVIWDGENRQLHIARDFNAKGVQSNYTPIDVPNFMLGMPAYNILETDIETYMGECIESYNINGRTIIQFDNLAYYGKLEWRPEEREIEVTLGWLTPEGSIAQSAGYREGYDMGYFSGHYDGCFSYGYGASYDDGYPAYDTEIYVESYRVGYAKGYDEGYWDGCAIAYTEENQIRQELIGNQWISNGVSLGLLQRFEFFEDGTYISGTYGANTLIGTYILDNDILYVEDPLGNVEVLEYDSTKNQWISMNLVVSVSRDYMDKHGNITRDTEKRTLSKIPQNERYDWENKCFVK